jgi:beta-lactamase superfamily II metal-dependent hydrolase
MYFYFGAREANEIYMRIEAMDNKKHEVLADFVESNNFDALNGFYESSFPLDGPSMLLFKNYKGRVVREGTIYILNYSVLQKLFNEGRINIVDDYFIIRAEINLQGLDEEVFGSSISHNTLERKAPEVYWFSHFGNADINAIQLPKSGATQVIIKDVGQGSWNEIHVNKQIQLVFDSGTHYSTKKNDVKRLLNGSDKIYEQSKPGLIISHWDVDHYHFLDAMSDQAIAAFSFILCRNFTPSLMSRVIFARLRKLNSNLIALSPDTRTTTLKETPLFDIYNNNRFVIFNSGVSRNRNKDGLSLLVRNSVKSILLPGDQHYGQFHHFVLPVFLSYPHIHYIVVPHHGGNAGTYKYSLHSGVTRGEAIISVGSNSYGHPFLKVMKCLTNDSFKVSRTDIHSRDISIQL